MAKRDPGFGAKGPKSDYVGYVLAAIVFGGVGLMKGLNEPSKQEPLAPGLHIVAASEKGDHIRVIARVTSVEGSTVKLEDGPNHATASVTPDAAARLVPGTNAVFACTVEQAGDADLRLAC
ncbi:MAG: hypothetical protein HOW73_33455 [Polyangiaceae bacterium]|nr:hypothetical protein [Polyangiaceae bacterium]